MREKELHLHAWVSYDSSCSMESIVTAVTCENSDFAYFCLTLGG